MKISHKISATDNYFLSSASGLSETVQSGSCSQLSREQHLTVSTKKATETRTAINVICLNYFLRERPLAEMH